MPIPKQKLDAALAANDAARQALEALREYVETEPTPDPEPSPAFTLRNPAGINLGQQSDFTSKLFANAAKTARIDTAATLNEHGWPMGDFTMYVARDIKGAAGMYQVHAKWAGPGAPNVVKGVGMGVKSVGVGDNDLRATVEAWDDNGGHKSLKFTNVPAGGFTHVEVLRPGAGAGMFMPEAIDAAKQFGGFARYMGWLGINSSNITHPTDIPVPRSAPHGNNPRGMRYGTYEEACIFSNETGLPAWLCVPATATTETVRHILERVNATLDPGLPAVWEWSNETWNKQPDFQQSKQIEVWVNEAIAAGDPDGLMMADNNIYYAQYRYAAMRAMKLAREARAASGRFYTVLATQYAPQLKPQLEWIQAHGNPNDFIAVAIAAYSYPGDAFVLRDDLTAGEIAAKFQQIGFQHARHVAECQALTAPLSLPLWGYEGGFRIGEKKNSADAKIAAHAEPLMEDAVLNWAKGWQAAAGPMPMNWFTFDGRYTHSLGWALNDDFRTDSPKQRGWRRWGESVGPVRVVSR